MFKYIKDSFARKKARRITQEHPYRIDKFNLKVGEIQFANWMNPLVHQKVITDNEVNFFRKFIQPGDFVIDIGAHTGDTTVPMALAAGKEGLTLGFDPNPFVFKLLMINAGLNKELTNIIPLPFAIADKDGEFFYNSSEASFANGGITSKQSKYHGKHQLSQKIKALDLKKYINSYYPEKLSKLSFIKVDAEGFDHIILISIKDILEKYHPVIIAECFKNSTIEERHQLFHSVVSNGYKLYKFDEFNENTPKVALTMKEDMSNWKTFNFYAIADRE